MATADICITRDSDAHTGEMAPSTNDLLADPYRYANVSRDESSDDEQQDVLVSPTRSIAQDIPDSAPPPPPAPSSSSSAAALTPPRRQLLPQRHISVGLSAVVDSVGRRFSDSGTPPIHSCINVAVEAAATPLPPPPYDGASTRSGTNETCCRGHHYLLSAVCGGINITKERVCIVLIIAIMIVFLVVLEKMIGVDIVDEKKLLQVLATGVLPVRQEQPTTSSAPQHQVPSAG
jgi:hypothetical protein